MVAVEQKPKDADDYPVYVRFKRHLQESFQWPDHDLDLFDDAYVAGLSGFQIEEAWEYPAVERLYSSSRVLQPRDRHFPAMFKVLRRRDEGVSPKCNL